MVVYSVKELTQLLRNLSPQELPQKVLTSHIITIVDKVQAGKTSVLSELIERLKITQLSVGGVIQPAMFTHERKAGYALQNILTGQKKIFVKRFEFNKQPGKFCYRFNETLWHWASECVHKASLHCNFVVVDELGKLEARGGGHMPALLQCLAQPCNKCQWILSIREDCFALCEQQVLERC